MSNTSATALLRSQYKGAHDVLEGTMADVAPDVLKWSPPGVANSVGGNYAHVVASEDVVFRMLQGEQPLMAGDWAGRSGLSEPPPLGETMHAWDKRVNLDLDALRAYAQAVYTNTDAYLASLTDADLETELDLSAMGFGTQKLGWLLNIMLANVQWHTGEIAALKGVQGYKGYPF